MNAIADAHSNKGINMNVYEIAAQRLYWDDLECGTKFVSASRTITEADVVNFACLSGDFNRLHVDETYASETPFGRRIAHGLLVVSVLSGLSTRMMLNVMMEKSILGVLDIHIKIPKPTFIGDTIHVEVEIGDKRETSKPERGVLTLLRRAINQHGVVVLQADFTLLVQRKLGER